MSRHYLLQESSSFFFRSYIPIELQHQLGGKKVFKLALPCVKRVEAKRLGNLLNQITQALYEQARMGKSITVGEMKELLRKELQKARKHSNFFAYVGVDRNNPTKLEEGIRKLEGEEEQLRTKLKKEYDEEVLAYLKKEGIDGISRSSNEFRIFRENYIQIQHLKIKWKKEMLRGEDVPEFDMVSQILNEGSIIDPAPKVTTTPIEPVADSRVEESIRGQEGGIVISELRDKFLERKEGSISSSLINEYRIIVNDLIEILGDVQLDKLTRLEVNEKYIEVQRKLPINRRKNPKYRDKGIQEILDMKGVVPQGGKNINKYLDRISAVMNWGKKQGYIAENIFYGLQIEIPKAERNKRRKPFESTDLKKIFTPAIYRKWTIEYQGKQKHISKYSRVYYWIFILGIFTGMRTNEICQLKIEDIYEDNNIPVISINESDGATVKTRSGIRKVPIHPTLVSLGFLEYVNLMKEAGHDRIFWELKKTSDGYTKQVSRHFNEEMLPSLGVWEKQVKVLYCTRHTFINKCYNKNLNNEVIKFLVGHEQDFTVDVYGGEPFTPEQLHQEISKIEYPEVDWNTLRAKWKTVYETI